MKKDLQSYEKHNQEYIDSIGTYHRESEVLKRAEELNIFKNSGFDFAISTLNPLPETHIDIGTGSGWLPKKTSSIFKKVIGIEPSHTAVELARKINKDNHNVTIVEDDMVDGLKKLNPEGPVFVTTATVLNHIEDYYVKEFLSVINELPLSSSLFFAERYDKNIQWTMWHVRSKDWWRENLPNWQLFFYDTQDDGYPSGIFGKCVGKASRLPNHTMTRYERCVWRSSFLVNVTKRVTKKLVRILTGK